MEIIPPQVPPLVPPITLSLEVSGKDRKLRKQVRQLYETINLMLANQHRQLIEERLMSETLDRLTREVAETRTVVESAKLLIGSLADQIREHVGDEAALVALADDLDRQQGELAAAVEAGVETGSGSGGGSVVEEPVSPSEPLPIGDTGEV